MFKKLSLTLLAVVTIGTLFSQTAEIYVGDSTVDISNQTHTVSLTGPTSLLVNDHLADFEFKNVSGTDQSWIITREIIQEPNDWSNRFCFGLNENIGLCLSANSDQFQNSGVITIPDDEYMKISTYVVAPSVGIGIYRYHYSTDGQTYLGYVEMTVEYALGMSDHSAITTIELYPNPTSELLNVTSSIGVFNNLRIIDISGQTIVKASSINESTISIDVSDFIDGTYMVILYSENRKPISKRFNIQH